MAQLRYDEVRLAINAAGVQWTPAETPVSMLDEARQRALLGAIPSPELRAAVAAGAPQAPPAAFPPVVDWRNNNGNHVSSVKSQGGCGSCVSFACVATTESMGHIEHAVWTDLSEADSHFCSTHGANCFGWWPDQCFDQIRVRGVCQETCFPYASAFPNGDVWAGPPQCTLCANRASGTVTVTSVAQLFDPVSAKNHLAAHGPVAGCLDVFADFFTYSSGVYTHVTGALMGGHCVQVIGYSEPEQCWIIKNSWDTTWGMNGFGKVAYQDLKFDGRFFPMYGVSGVVLPTGS